MGSPYQNQTSQLKSRLKLLHRILNSKSPITLKHKLTNYKDLLRLIWTYGIELFGSAKKSNLNKIQAFQSKLLRLITGAQAYVNNRTLHLDLNTPYIDTRTKDLYRRSHEKTFHHSNPLITRTFKTTRWFKKTQTKVEQRLTKQH
jgi:hypothetical protein